MFSSLHRVTRPYSPILSLTHRSRYGYHILVSAIVLYVAYHKMVQWSYEMSMRESKRQALERAKAPDAQERLHRLREAQQEEHMKSKLHSQTRTPHTALISITPTPHDTTWSRACTPAPLPPLRALYVLGTTHAPILGPARAFSSSIRTQTHTHLLTLRVAPHPPGPCFTLYTHTHTHTHTLPS